MESFLYDAGIVVLAVAVLCGPGVLFGLMVFKK